MKLQINHLVKDEPWNELGIRKAFIETDNVVGWSKKEDVIIIEVEHRPTYTFTKYSVSLNEAKRIEDKIVEYRKKQIEKRRTKETRIIRSSKEYVYASLSCCSLRNSL